MGSRHLKFVFGATMFAGLFCLLAVAVPPEKAGAATDVKTCGGDSLSLKAREKRTLSLHNAARTSRGLRPLCADPRLTRAARSHSREMIKKDYMAHASYNGESVRERLERFGYNRSVYAENIAGGSGQPGKPGSIFGRWMDSPPHRTNILDGRFRPVGVGSYTGNYKGTRNYTMYTVDFGVRG